MTPQHAFADRAQALQRSLRGSVQVVRAELDSGRGPLFECMAKEEELAFGVDTGALHVRSQPGPADLQSTVGQCEVVVAGFTNSTARLSFHNGKGHAAAGALIGQRTRD